MTFVDAARLRRPDTREVVFGVEGCVANDEVRFAVEVGGAGFGDDLNASAPGAVKLRGVRIVIDADFLNGRGGDAYTLHLDAIDDEGSPAGRTGGSVEERGEGCDIVLVEDW